ncbi:DNA/RNA non-specific endonuclease [Flavobacterium psychrotrophum]|uniref:DNA/RNA non-specific endonuclease n=1 Tax=Flavobacterium psychrotrophum TaxID=2294119 RepID=UPI000E31DA75|nr:DNA/RNA non-specific endonuclease [Flavobacterium psychrotrophum]
MDTRIKIILACFLFYVTAALKAQEHLAPLFSYSGLPKGVDVQVLYNQGFIIGYSNALKNPLWACYRLGNAKGAYGTAEEKIEKWERPFQFQHDIRTQAQVTHQDYEGSGYDRGHMAPDAAIQAQYGQRALMETYLMSNIIPQHKDLNRGIWQKLEEYERKTLSQDDTNGKEVNDLYVITGPVFATKPDTLASGVAVPTHCFKIYAYKRGYQGTVKTVAFLFPQHPQSDEFNTYLTTVDAIEKLTGLDFFSELTETKQRNLESKKRDFTLTEIP